MLFLIPQIPKHQAYRLNKHIRLFFRRLANVDGTSNFNPVSNYFHSEFANWLNRPDQLTLKSHFEAFFDRFKVLPSAQRLLVVQRFSNSQNIENILNDILIDGQLFQAKTIPRTLRPLVKELFKYLYQTTLVSFGQIKDHYQSVYNMLETKTCPFCGIERLNAPSLRKQDYDHILNQSKYPYGSVNMRNLVPMGTECNRSFKGSTDVIYQATARVKYYSPFILSHAIKVSLTGSIPPNDFDTTGNWKVKIHPNNTYTRRWEAVFKIKKRYAEQMLNGCYVDWMKDFKIYIKRHGLPTNSVEIRAKFKEMGEMLLENPLSEPNLVKGAFYRFLSTYTNRTYNRAVMDFIRS